MISDGELGRRDYVSARNGELRAVKQAVGAADLEEMTEYSSPRVARACSR